MCALMSVKVIRAKCLSHREPLKTKCRQSFGLPWVDGRVLIKIFDMLHLPKCGNKENKIHPLSLWKASSLFLIRGLFATGNDRKLLDSKQTLMGEPSRSLSR